MQPATLMTDPRSSYPGPRTTPTRRPPEAAFAMAPHLTYAVRPGTPSLSRWGVISRSHWMQAHAALPPSARE
jgi:hypothetical protein